MSDQTPPAFSPVAVFFNFIQNRPTIFMLAVLLTGLITRILVLPTPGFEADISFWKSWGLAQYDHGIVWSLENTNNNYPSAFAYVLGIMVRIYSIFADPHNYFEFWSNNNLLFLTISKMPSVLSDFGIIALFVLLGKIIRNKSGRAFPGFGTGFYIFLGALYLLNPVSVIDGAWWGQVDSVGVFIFLVSVFLVVKNKPFWAGFIYMAAMMTKLQNMIYGPVFFIFVWQYLGFHNLIKSIAGSVTAFLGLNYEFFLARKMDIVWRQLTVNYDYFPFLSLNAYNFWWIVAKGDGMHILDKYLFLGITNSKTTGLFMFASLYLGACIMLVRDRFNMLITKIQPPPGYTPDKKTVLYQFFSALVIVAGAFFLFQTESHDRYAFPITVFMLFWVPFYLNASSTLKERDKIFSSPRFRNFLLLYVTYSLVYFYNLHNALIDNYPGNGIPFLSVLHRTDVTLAASAAHIALFSIFMWSLRRHFGLATVVIPLVSFCGLMVFSNMPLLLSKPIYITRLSPLISRQDYGSRQTDMAVNSGNGIKSWNPLSVQYAFYRKGIGTHAKSYHQYHINGLFKTFTTDFGIDTEAAAGGSATFEIYGDDKLLFKSKVMGRFDMPGHARVDVTGIKSLGLVTNDGGNGINDDHTDWLNPILWP